ncbi:MAG: hypothetical protein IJH37_11465 [Clostridia bacterium]|nr:hypothetical protein [Clostridia bacterium]
MNSKLKKVSVALAGVLAALCVASYVPVNVETGGIFSDTSITASAEDVQITSNDLNEGLVIDAGTTIKFLIRTFSGYYQPFVLNIYLDGEPDKEVDSIEPVVDEPDRYYTTTKKCKVYSYENIGNTQHTLYLKSLHTVTWKNEDGTVLKTEEAAKGDTPSYGSEPTKAEDDQYTYTFAGWTDGTNTYGVNDTLPGVTADVSYTAQFTATKKVTPATVKGEVTRVAANNEGYNSDGTKDNGATAFITKLTKSGDGEITVGSVTWDITSNGVNKVFTKSIELPTMTFSGDSTEVTLAFVVDGLYDTDATVNVTVQ